MKTVICDICGKSKEEFLRKGLNVSMNNFQRTSFWCGKREEREFDICAQCLIVIRELSLGKNNEES